MRPQPSTVTSANVYMPLGIDNSWNHQEFMQQFKIEIKDIKEDFMEFDMIGVDPAIANALRRILIAEVPTVAIEHVFIINNTSIIQVSRIMAAFLPAACWPASQPAQSTRHEHAAIRGCTTPSHPPLMHRLH